MVHCFERAGLFLALDVGSGTVHILSKAAFAVLSRIDEQALKAPGISQSLAAAFEKEGLPENELTEAFLELQQLADEGLLFADDSYTAFGDALGEAPVKAMCLHVAHDCNLRCQYCFASTGGFGGCRKLMPIEVAQKAIDHLITGSGNRRNLEVDFFGGEPLMNFEVVKQTVAYARKREKETDKNFRFTITTNGLALNEDIIDYINREMSNVVLSLDGRKEVNDAMRPKIDGSGTYDTIVPKFQQLVALRQGKEYYVRGTYTRNNVDFDADVLSLWQLGFDQISVEPVVGPEQDDYSIRSSDVPSIEKAYERLMQELIHRRKTKREDFNFFHFMVDLENGPCAIKRLKGCGCGNEYLAVTPDGELFPCHQFVGQPEFMMGHVDTGIIRKDLKTQFAEADLLHKPDCQTCWAKLFCSGGCNANNQQFCGSILKPHTLSCELEKVRLECAIAIQAVLAVE